MLSLFCVFGAAPFTTVCLLFVGTELSITNIIADTSITAVRGYNSAPFSVAFDLLNVETTGDIAATSSGSSNFAAGCYLSQTDASALTANADGSSVFTGSTTAYEQSVVIPQVDNDAMWFGLAAGGSERIFMSVSYMYVCVYVCVCVFASS